MYNFVSDFIWLKNRQAWDYWYIPRMVIYSYSEAPSAHRIAVNVLSGKNQCLISRNRIFDIKKSFSDIKKRTRDFSYIKSWFSDIKIQSLDINK